MSLSERLREARELAGLSQGQVANKLDMHRPTITEIEAGRRKVSTDELQKFSAIYMVSTEWLLSGDGENGANDARMMMAARELSQMSDKDIERMMKMLKMLQKSDKK